MICSLFSYSAIITSLTEYVKVKEKLAPLESSLSLFFFSESNEEAHGPFHVTGISPIHNKYFTLIIILILHIYSQKYVKVLNANAYGSKVGAE